MNSLFHLVIFILQLARIQTDYVRDKLKELYPDVELQIGEKCSLSYSVPVHSIIVLASSSLPLNSSLPVSLSLSPAVSDSIAFILYFRLSHLGQRRHCKMEQSVFIIVLWHRQHFGCLGIVRL